MKGSLFYGKVWRHRFRAACTFWLGWAEVEMGAEGDKEGNQSPRGKLQGNTAHRLGNWSASSLHCWKDRNGKKCLQCSGIMHSRKFWAACLWERWRDHSSPFVLFFFIVFPANFFFFFLKHYWGIVVLPCSVSFYIQQSESVVHIYTSTFLRGSFPI